MSDKTDDSIYIFLCSLFWRLLRSSVLRLRLIAMDVVCCNAAFYTRSGPNVRSSLLRYLETLFFLHKTLSGNNNTKAIFCYCEKMGITSSTLDLLYACEINGRNYVVQYIIEQKMGGVNVMFELRGNYVKLATQKFGSHVVEKCLRHYPESRAQIVRELVSVQNFEHLLQDPFANYVIQSALSVTKVSLVIILPYISKNTVTHGIGLYLSRALFGRAWWRRYEDMETLERVHIARRYSPGAAS